MFKISADIRTLYIPNTSPPTCLHKYIERRIKNNIKWKKKLFRNINQQFKTKDCYPSHTIGPEVDYELLQFAHPRFETLNPYGETLTHSIHEDFFDF